MSAIDCVAAKGLSDSPIDAASEFHARIVPEIRELMQRSDLIVVAFEPADYTHSAWRVAAIQELARKAAPGRVNAVVASPENPNLSAQALQFLADSPGITGQVLEVAPD